MYFTSQELYYNHNRITNITGSVINIDLLSSLRKLPCLCIMFYSSVSSNIPTSPAATSILVVLPSGPGDFFSGIIYNL